MKDDITFEKKIKRLEEIVSILESGDKPIDLSVALFKEGIALSKECRETLDNIQQKISSVDIDNDVIKLQKVEDNE